MTNTAWACSTLSIVNVPLLDSIASSARSLIAKLNPSSVSSREAFDFCFSLVAFSWAFAFVAESWKTDIRSTVSPTIASWARGISRALLCGILAIGQELDRRTISGDSDALAGGMLSWVCKVAPGAQGGYASVSKAVGPPAAKSPFLCQETPHRSTHSGYGHTTEHPAVAPSVAALLRGIIVVAKPVNWEVDGLTSDGDGALLLSSFVQSILPRSASALVHTVELDYGFVHRLDVPSSGLILGGTSFEGLFQLKWQIAVYSIDRQYFTTNHGHVGSSRLDIDEGIDATAENMRSLTADAGKPARTHLGLVAHLQFKQFEACTSHAYFDGGSASATVELCICLISIHTGRRHQIRAHTRHVGHPCATDARYTPRDVMLQFVRS